MTFHEGDATALELLNDAPFHAPMQGGLIDGLLGQYAEKRRQIETVAGLFEDKGYSKVVAYFIDGNRQVDGLRYSLPTAEKIFRKVGAIAALNSDFWTRALRLTDVFECMPQARRDAWNEQIRQFSAPDFEDETVRATLEDLLAARSTFFAERVDGVFRKLSQSHVTNTPQGFGKRMIIAGVLSEHGYTDSSRIGYIDDLRKIVAKFMGRGDPPCNGTNAALYATRRRNGEWMDFDGGALRIRTYKIGTAHLEVHPEMAWRLNCVLASLYPTAIPSQFREPPKRKAKEHKAIARPLPSAVIEVIAGMRAPTVPTEPIWRGGRRAIANALQFMHHNYSKAVEAEACAVLAQIGGVKVEGHIQFDYDPTPAVDELICSGCIPDQKTHQFYPTPVDVADKVIELAGVEPGMRCLEPSAGQGALAERLGPNVTCIELSELHCTILRAKGLEATCADFLAVPAAANFDRVVLNPPYSEGRALQHLVAAAAHVVPGGRLVAVLPASMWGKALLPGVDQRWVTRFHNAFAGCSVSVGIFVADFPGMQPVPDGG